MSSRKLTIFAVATLLSACVLLLPRLGDGLWEPDEVEAVVPFRLHTAPQPGVTELPARLGARSAEASAGLFGTGDVALRLPGLGFALALLMASFVLATLLGGPTAGILTACVLMTCPGFLYQSIRVTGDVGVACAATLVMLGAVLPYARRAERVSMKVRVLGAVIAMVGGATALFGHSAAQGFWLPVLAIGLAFLTPGSVAPERQRALRVFGALIVVMVVVAAGLQVVEWRPGYPGERALFGWTFGAQGNLSPWFPSYWDIAPNPETTFESALKEMAFGMFPWSILIPIALVTMVRRSSTWPEWSLLWWGLGSWTVATVLDRHSAGASFLATPAVAIAIALWMARYLRAEKEKRLRPALGLFLLFGAIILARDLASMPAELASLSLSGGALPIKELGWFGKALVGLGAAFGLSWFAYAAIPRTGKPLFGPWYGWVRRFADHGVSAALVCAGISILLISFVLTPQMTRTLSRKHLFQAYEQRAAPGQRLGVMGDLGASTDLYAPASTERLPARPQLIDFLAHADRVFALMKKTELCPLHSAAAAGGVPYYVLDEVADYLLLSNRLGSGEVDANPLKNVILRSEPQDIGRHVSARYQDLVELIGVTMPQRVEHGRSFEVKLYFQVIAPLHSTWKVLVHFDAKNTRFNGDHDATAGLCDTANWQAGDYIVDTFKVTAGEPGKYDLWTGFFRGSEGNFVNMPVTSDHSDGNNRTLIGSLEVN